jgi:cytochrome c
MKTAIKLGVAAIFVMSAGSAFAQAGDAAKGEQVFKQCRVCHAVGPGAKSGVGPAQNNVVGAKAGSRPGYNYSEAMKKAGEGGLVWNEENLDKYLENPRGVVQGTKMAFAGLKKKEDRDNVIAYLKTQKSE